MRNPFRLFTEDAEHRALQRARAARLRAALVEIDCALARLPDSREKQQLQAHAAALSMAAPTITPEPDERF